MMPNFDTYPPATTPLDGTEKLLVSQGGFTRDTTTGDIAALGGGNSTVTIAGGSSAMAPLIAFATGGYIPGSGGDDAPALAAAMAAGGQVMLPAGTLKISAPFTVPAGAYLVGQGTTIQPTASMTSMLTLTGAGYVAGIKLSDVSGFAPNGFTINKAQNDLRLTVTDCEAVGFTTGFLVTGGDVTDLVRPRTQNCGTALLVTDGFLNSSVVQPYFVNGNGIDIHVPATLQCEGLQVLGGKILPSTAGAFGVRLLAGLKLGFFGVIVDQLAASGANGFLIDSTNLAIEGIDIVGCYTGKNISATTTGSGIKIVGAAAKQVNIDNHTFRGHYKYGLETTTGTGGLTTDLVVSNSRFSSCTLADISLNSCRATFVAVESTHASASIMCGGSQAQYSDIGCRFTTAPQAGSLVGGVSIGSLGTIADRFVKELTVTSGGFDVTGNSTVRGTLSSTGILSGANLATGNGDPTGAIAGTPGDAYQRISTDGTTSVLDHEFWVNSTGGTGGWKAMATQDFLSRQISNSLPSLGTTFIYGGSGAAGAAQQVTPSAPLSLSGGNLTVATATTSVLGVVKPDGTTITISNGVITSTASGPGGTIPSSGGLLASSGVSGTAQAATNAQITTAMAAWFASLSTSLPGSAGQPWNNGGSLAFS